MSAPVTTPALTEFDRLHRAWRHARAKWEFAETDPANPEGLTEQEDAEYCDRDHAALLAFLTYPATSTGEIARKLQVIVGEQAWALDAALEIFSQMSIDARRIALAGRKAVA